MHSAGSVSFLLCALQPVGTVASLLRVHCCYCSQFLCNLFSSLCSPVLILLLSLCQCALSVPVCSLSVLSQCQCALSVPVCSLCQCAHSGRCVAEITQITQTCKSSTAWRARSKKPPMRTVKAVCTHMHLFWTSTSTRSTALSS